MDAREARSNKCEPFYDPEDAQSLRDKISTDCQELKQLKAELHEALGGWPGRIKLAVGTVGVKLTQLARPSKSVV